MYCQNIYIWNNLTSSSLQTSSCQHLVDKLPSDCLFWKPWYFFFVKVEKFFRIDDHQKNTWKREKNLFKIWFFIHFLSKAQRKRCNKSHWKLKITDTSSSGKNFFPFKGQIQKHLVANRMTITAKFVWRAINYTKYEEENNINLKVSEFQLDNKAGFNP